MIKQLPLVFVLLLVSFNSIIAQTGNQTTGSAITPNQSGDSHTPFPYDGTQTFTPGPSLTTGDWNLSVGPGAGASLGVSYSNILIGGMAGALLNESTTGVDAEDNIVIGTFAADLTLSASDNVFIGNYVARNATGNDNVVVGHRAGQQLTTGVDNVIIGEQAGRSLTDGDDNVLIGEDAGFDLTTGNDNCFVGSRAGANTTTANGNTFVGGESSSSIPGSLGNGVDYDFVNNGSGAGERNTTGQANTFIGSGAGLDNVDGFANTFLGYAAGANSQHADGNTFLGYGAGWDNNRSNNRNDANRNTYVGVLTGGINREGSDNVGMGWKADFIGNGSFGSSANRNNRNIFLGNSVSVFGDDQVIIGHQARSTGNQGSITIGSLSSTADSYSAAIGYDVDVTQANTMALGGNTTTNRFSVGIGTIAANQNASLELADTDKGFLINRVTTVQRTDMETAAANGNPLATTEAGMMVYDTDLSALFIWDGTQWINSTLDTDTDTDNQTIDVFQLNGNDLELSLEDDATVTQVVDLSSFLDNTDSQELSLATNILSISGGTNTINLSGYLDNTDAQDLQLSSNILSLTNDATSVDLSGYLDNTDNQELSLSNAILSISGGSNTVDLSTLQDGTGTDSQTLDLTNDVLSISNGNTVDFSAYVNTDGQDLSSASLSGTDLTIAIENGASVTVDLSPLLTDIENRLALLEQTLGVQENNLNKAKTAILYQNIPNPFNGTSSIKYYLPSSVSKAAMVFSNTSGQVISTVTLDKRGDGTLAINRDGLASGTYFYSLYVEGSLIDTKKMVIE
ncbi:T9SS type A sorting domain-containing protein [Aquimarina sp. MMG016]|uniref:beta strand repeat-containing protein n=1 Tax=Aquimarina sp. MMG016 TaxID=2822690 RepID=UPI001B3A53A6|nr:T9SS type A sorting domain-containing protein [Aquimarina sp. MMG016]MBQ4821724.1 T9SS type A sorting domain-containing protein [Aquimarina sp. MMG016]